MALRREYDDEICPVARSLEMIGERWTLLIIRDAFYGVTRFNGFRAHLRVPPAVLSQRLRLLVEHGIMTTSVAATGREEYHLTDKGEQLWPTLWSLMRWGNDYLDEGLRRSFVHADCGGAITASGACGKCGLTPGPRDLMVHPRPRQSEVQRDDPVSRKLARPHRLLESLSGHA